MEKSLIWRWCAFSDLTLQEMHGMFALRSEVFVLEQECAYQDIDGTDPAAYHLVVLDGKEVVATLRVFGPMVNNTAYATIGRVVVAKQLRKDGLGHTLMKRGIDATHETFGVIPIKISAQSYLREFYGRLGFVVCGEGYLEDGIPHLPMKRSA
jgi:ElaA protein